jgi:TPP-dependent pyruvate/acetoin dehydrogenase alpha subunit
VNPEHAYKSVALIRGFEERLPDLKAAGKIQGSMHFCNGQEAIPVGACAAIENRDALMVTYRGHGWAIARGIPVPDLFAEIMGRDSGLCGGRGGSAFFSSAEHGFLGENSIVGAGVPIAAGSALAARFDGGGSVTFVSIGEGAMNQGSVHEALNFAAVFQLPLVMVIENNLYSELTPIASMIATATLAERGPAYGIPAVRVDGNDVDEVESAVREAAVRARDGGGPGIIEAMTERLVGHYDLDPQHYRPQGEVESARQREPLVRLRATIGSERASEIDREVEATLSDAIAEADAVPFPSSDTAREHLYA